MRTHGDCAIADADRDILAVLRELHEENERLSASLRDLAQTNERHHSETAQRLDSLRKAINGESVVGRHAAARVEERLTAIEHRLDALEQGR